MARTLLRRVGVPLILAPLLGMAVSCPKPPPVVPPPPKTQGPEAASPPAPPPVERPEPPATKSD